MLGLEFTKKKREKYGLVAVTMLFALCALTYYVCRWVGEPFYDSWVSSAGEGVVAFAILTMQITFIKQIATLINESQLDLVPKPRTFCRNLSVVGFIFLV